MGKKEIFYVVCAIALLIGAYFFIHKLMFPSPRSFAVYTVPQKSKAQRQREYFQKNEKKILAQARRDQIKTAKEYEKIRPYLKIQQEYAKNISVQIAKLPPDKRNNQKEIKKIVDKEREKYMYMKMPGQKSPPLGKVDKRYLPRGW